MEIPIGENARMDKVIDFINVNRDRYLEELKALLAIPSISALPQHAGDVKRCADWCADEMRRIGLRNVRLIDTPGNPVVYGDWLDAAGAPTILFYGHYDVQPVDPLELWASPPCGPSAARCRSTSSSWSRGKRRPAASRSRSMSSRTAARSSPAIA